LMADRDVRCSFVVVFTLLTDGWQTN